MVLKVFTDGGSKGNPGPSSIGIVMYINNKKIFQQREDIGVATNNEAEYQALIKALENVKKRFLDFSRNDKISSPVILSESDVTSDESRDLKIEFYSDSRLMVNQVNGIFKVKSGKIKEYILKIRCLEQEINLPVSYCLIPREQNQEADRLVNSL